MVTHFDEISEISLAAITLAMPSHLGYVVRKYNPWLWLTQTTQSPTQFNVLSESSPTHSTRGKQFLLPLDLFDSQYRGCLQVFPLKHGHHEPKALSSM
jgi:hypothetical protein